MKIIHKKIVFNGKLIVEEAVLSAGQNEIKRQRVNRQDAAAVLILNTDSGKILLAKQYRYAIADKSGEEILEIVAGKIDEGESPLAAAIRETEEETGYKINPGNIRFLLSCFSSPGYTSELFYIYYATVSDAGKISKGGGIKSEGEDIEVAELDIDKFRHLLTTGGIKDAKTYVAGLYMLDKLPGNK